jgi:ATP phosphoribosyltransferase regulatory subunit HisZ
MKFVIVIKVERNPLIEALGTGFEWEVRELLKEATGDLIERAGPGLARGRSDDAVAAKAAAEAAAERFAEESVYIYNTEA